MRQPVAGTVVLSCVLAFVVTSGGAQQLSPEERARAAQSIDSEQGLIVPAALANIDNLGVSACTRLIGVQVAADSTISTVDVGCRGPRNGISGVLVLVSAITDIASIFQQSKADGYNRVAVVSSSILSESFFEAVDAATAPEAEGQGGSIGAPGIQGAGLAGVIVLMDREVTTTTTTSSSSSSRTPLPYSPASLTGTPSGRGTPAGGATWNSRGRNLLNRRISIPVVAASGASADSVVEAARRNSGGAEAGPARWGARLRYFMGPETLSPLQCLGFGQCLPLGGQTVWASLGGDVDDVGGNGQLPTQRGWALLATRIDTTAFFHGRAKGVATAAGNTIVTLAAAAALAGESTVAALPFRPVVALFQAEAAGRAGSRRWVHEAIHGLPCTQPSVAAKSPYGRRGCLAPAVRADGLSLTGMGLGKAVAGVGGGGGLGPVLVVELPATARTLAAAAARVGGQAAQPVRIHQTRSAAANQSFVRLVVQTVGVEMTGALLERPQGVAASAGSRSAADPAAALPRAVLPPSPLDTLLDARDAGPLAERLLGGGSAVLSGVDTDADEAAAALFGSGDNGTVLAGSLDAAALTDMATLVARSMFALGSAGDDPAAAAASVPATLRASRQLVEQLLVCLTQDAACPLARNVTGLDATTLEALATGSGGGAGDSGTGTASAPPPLFSSVYTAPIAVGSGGTGVLPSWYELLLRNTLADATANVSATPCTTDADCTAAGLPSRFECVRSRGLCARTAAHYHAALSPAVMVTGSQPYAINTTLLTEADPAWTEPYWSLRIRTELMLLPPPSDGAAVLAAGIAITLVAGPLTWWWAARGRKAWKIE